LNSVLVEKTYNRRDPFRLIVAETPRSLPGRIQYSVSPREKTCRQPGGKRSATFVRAL
jgi:hypothetical protein